MNVKYQIFVSSTYEDLKDERNEVIKACLNMGHIPVGMEMFNAADEEQWAVITRTIDQCDYYVVIVAHRYGSTVDGVSFTEKEYDYAVEQGVPVLGFVINDGAPWPNDRVDKDPVALEALTQFKAKVKQKLVRFWRDKSELQAHFAISLATTININSRRGWVRAPEATDVDVAQTLSNLTEENSRLRQTLDELRSAQLPEDHANEVIQLLKLEVLKMDDETKLTGSDVFQSLASDIEDGYQFSTIIQNLSRNYDIDKSAAQHFLKKLQLWDVIQPRGSGRQLTPLGRQVYKRFDLAPSF